MSPTNDPRLDTPRPPPIQLNWWHHGLLATLLLGGAGVASSFVADNTSFGSWHRAAAAGIAVLVVIALAYVAHIIVLATNRFQPSEETRLDAQWLWFRRRGPPPMGVPAPGGSLQPGVLGRVIGALFRRKSATFDFTTLGVRVPAIVVSPFVARARIDPTVRDHASVPATLRALFAPQADPLSARDHWSPPFHSLLTLTAPRTTDLPDLSAYVTSSPAAPAGAASLAPPPPGPAAAPTPEPPMPEHYSELDELTKLVDQKLPGPTQAPTTGPRARAQRVTAAFEAEASLARTS